MFRDAIESFRNKTNDTTLWIDENAESDASYQRCCDFLDEYAHVDSEDVLFLSDYITYGQFGEGRVHKRLLDILATLCRKYAIQAPLSINNRSYCNSMMTAVESADNSYLYL